MRLYNVWRVFVSFIIFKFSSGLIMPTTVEEVTNEGDRGYTFSDLRFGLCEGFEKCKDE